LALLQEFDNQMDTYGYDKDFTSIDYSTGDYRALGNYMASEMIAFGLQDGSNEQNGYANQYYTPVNDPLIMETGYYTDTNDLNDPNHWQPLAFETFIDQNGLV